MNQEESTERDAREERHTVSQRDIRDIKHQVDRLTGEVGKMAGGIEKLTTAFTGDDLGAVGMIEQVRRIIAEQIDLKNRLSVLELATAKKQMYLLAFVTTVGIVIGGIVKSVIDHLFKK